MRRNGGGRAPVALAVCTPTRCVLCCGTVMLMVPLFFLYEFSIYLSKLIWKKKRARQAEGGKLGRALVGYSCKGRSGIRRVSDDRL